MLVFSSAVFLLQNCMFDILLIFCIIHIKGHCCRMRSNEIFSRGCQRKSQIDCIYRNQENCRLQKYNYVYIHPQPQLQPNICALLTQTRCHIILFWFYWQIFTHFFPRCMIWIGPSHNGLPIFFFNFVDLQSMGPFILLLAKCWCFNL